MKIKKRNLLSVVIVLALVAGTTVVFSSSPVETKALGLFEHMVTDDASQYVDHINEVTDTEANVVTDDYSVAINSTIFTDHQVYAIISLKGNHEGSPNINGRITYVGNDQTQYALAGELKEIEVKDDVRYYLYSAAITEFDEGRPKDPMLVLAAGDQFSRHSSLRDSEGDLLEITVSINEDTHILTAPIANVSSQALVFHPEADLYEDDYFDTIVLTPYQLKLSGTSDVLYEDARKKDGELWFGPYIKITIVMTDNTEINFSYDTRGLIYDEFYTTSRSLGYNDITGEFYGYWNFRNWEVDVSEVSALIIDGVEYRVTK